MGKHKIIIFLIIGLGCLIGISTYLFSSDKEDIDSELSNLDRALKPKTISINQTQNGENIKSDIGNELAVSGSKHNSDGVEAENSEASKMLNRTNRKINSPYDDGIPGVSRSELYALIERQSKKIEREQKNPDAIVIQATESQPAVTRRELAALHAKQMRQIQEELNNPDAIVIEATENQPAVTRAELQEMHAEQMRQIQEELNDPDAIVIEATETQPAVTRGELEALHREQLKQMRREESDPAAPAIENEDGTVITNRELAALHEKQRYEMFVSEFNGDEVIIEEKR